MTRSSRIVGRRQYQQCTTCLVRAAMEEFWTAPERADGHEVEAEFAREYTATARILLSDSLKSVAPGCQLVHRADAVDEVVRLETETDGDLSVGGAGLAAS